MTIQQNYLVGLATKTQDAIPNKRHRKTTQLGPLLAMCGISMQLMPPTVTARYTCAAHVLCMIRCMIKILPGGKKPLRYVIIVSIKGSQWESDSEFRPRLSIQKMSKECAPFEGQWEEGFRYLSLLNPINVLPTSQLCICAGLSYLLF